jgi:pimeloyl-ACP methyl ester carboxylesterase
MDAPEILYARSGELHIAYQVFGRGELDLVLVPGFFTHLELMWEHDPAARVLRRLGSFARVVLFDRRGAGLSDPVSRAPTLEERMDDVRAVMDAAGFEHAALFGLSEGVSMCILFAATYPDRVQALVCYGGLARSTAADDYPWAATAEGLIAANAELVAPYWGQGATVEVAAPSRAEDPSVRAFFARMERMSASPGMFARLGEMFLDIDVREVARTVTAPTLVIHRRHDHLVNVRHGRWLAENMPDARLVEIPGTDHNFFYQDPEAVLGEAEEFLTGTRLETRPDRALATVVFADIVGSTQAAADVGDREWREVLERHQAIWERTVQRYGGRAVKWLGDGLLATFDGPGRAIVCARAIVDASARLGLRVRAGVHTGEIELLPEDIGGIGVHIAARVADVAGPGEVLVSRTVKDLVAGSGIRFTERGFHELRGLDERWALYAAGQSAG